MTAPVSKVLSREEYKQALLEYHRKWQYQADDAFDVLRQHDAAMRAERAELVKLVTQLASLLEQTPKLMSIDVGVSWQNHIASVLALAQALASEKP